MSYKEALKEIEYALEKLKTHVAWEVDMEALKVAKEALEKRIPKKINSDNGFGGRCPVCGYYIVKSIFSSKGHKYCPECGQKLDWEVKE